ncbi:phosphotransferase [Salinactinospora qingdaonensis]|uniref:Aminoglycoside phosphotransferase domain-containing protein n=1 Tax=Salinactinospora qingdaonensis TaxID=702744 RepID=A0ABP7FNY7_9ACTN
MSAPTETAEVSACLRQYGRRLCGAVRRLPGGHVGQVNVVPTENGPLVAKRFGSRFTPERIELAAQAHHHAARAGLAPPLCLTRSGRRIAHVEDATYLVTEYIYHAQQAGLTCLGSALAALHRCLDHFIPDQDCADFLQLPTPPTADLKRLRQQICDTTIRDAIDWRIHILETYGLDAQAMATLSCGWVHGDARLENLVAADPNRPLFVDFDQVSRFPRPYEIVRAFVTSIPPGMSAPDSAFRTYLDAYHRIRSIEATDRAVMIDLFITVQAAESRTFTTTQDEVRGMSAFARARHHQLTWVIDHRARLRRIAEEARP